MTIQKHRFLMKLATYKVPLPAGILLAIAWLMLVPACTGLRQLPEDQLLYTGSRIVIEKQEDFADDRDVEAELKKTLRPVPNSIIWKSRPAMWMYLVAGEPRGKGLRHWMRNRLGEAPVLFEEVNTERNMRLLSNRLYNMGYFDAGLDHMADTSRRSVSLEYRVSVLPPYRFGDLHPMPGDGDLSGAVNRELENSLIVPGEPYDLTLLRRERQRIDRALKQQGYFYFHPDHIIFHVDSTPGNRRVDVYPAVKSGIPDAAKKKYHIGNIYIHADYMAGGPDGLPEADTLLLGEGMYFTDALHHFDAATIVRAVFLKTDSLYDIRDHDRTLNHLISLQTFRFVNLRFTPGEAQGRDVLDVRVLLTPLERKSLTAELRGVTKSNHFAGPGLETAFTNNNLFGGAESLKLGINGSYEWLVGHQRRGSAREFGLDASLSWPGFLLPAGWKTSLMVLNPKTTMSLGTNFLTRTDAFRLNTIHARYGYAWNRDPANRLHITPLVLNIFVLGDVDETIEGVRIGGSLLRKDLFEQFILGGQYSWTHNSRLLSPGTSDWFIHLNLDLSGNMAYLLMRYILFSSPEEEGEYAIFNQRFAQYVKFDADFRHYRQLGSGSKLAARLFLGAGIPYGNSSVLPYAKQFVIGGPISIRAFYPRSLGPGTYSPSDDDAGGYGIHRTGDLKLEGSLEYRFDITSLFKGAVFVDAGNIWRWADDEHVPGGRFDPGHFLGEIAMGAGTGLRIDAGFFVLRFDFAFPLADPANDTGGYFDPVRLFDRTWRRDNLVFNLAVGYLF